MTATDELRRMLDERGVEHEGGERSVRWRDRNGVMMQAFPLANGELGMGVWSCTPAQAIAATLGSEDTYTREDVEGAFVSGYSLGSLPVGSDPQWDENRQTVDEHMAEWGWARIVRCRDCKHGHKGGTLCNFFETWFPIAGGDEYEFMPADVDPDGYCAWGERKEVLDG